MIECAFSGSLTRDATPKISKSGKSYVQLNVKIGEADAAVFANVLAFDPQAIEAAAAGKLTKGATLYIEGRLELRSWTGNDGVTRQGLSVMARYCRLPEIGRHKPKRERPKKAAATTTTGTTSGEKPAAPFDDPIPF